MGGLKLYNKLLQFREVNSIKMGRDLFFRFINENNLIVRKRKTHKTTNSAHHYKRFDNLIKDFTPTAPNQLFVSDITYIETEEDVYYLSLVTDAYSRKIVGWALGDTLEAKYTVEALFMAIKSTGMDDLSGLIHHSDRGVQYCCHRYVEMLNEYNIQISMTQSGDPLENAQAERINGILKDEWLYRMAIRNKEELLSTLNRIIAYYNEERPHYSINMLTPNQAHQMTGYIPSLWKKKSSHNEIA